MLKIKIIILYKHLNPFKYPKRYKMWLKELFCIYQRVLRDQFEMHVKTNLMWINSWRILFRITYLVSFHREILKFLIQTELLLNFELIHTWATSWPSHKIIISFATCPRNMFSWSRSVLGCRNSFATSTGLELYIMMCLCLNGYVDMSQYQLWKPVRNAESSHKIKKIYTMKEFCIWMPIFVILIQILQTNCLNVGKTKKIVLLYSKLQEITIRWIPGRNHLLKASLSGTNCLTSLLLKVLTLEKSSRNSTRGVNRCLIFKIYF